MKLYLKQTIWYLGTAMKIRQHCAKSFMSKGVQTCRELAGCAFTNIKIAQIHHKINKTLVFTDYNRANCSGGMIKLLTKAFITSTCTS